MVEDSPGNRASETFGNHGLSLSFLMDRNACDQIVAEQRQVEETICRIGAIIESLERSELRTLGQQRRILVSHLFQHFHRMEADIYPTLLQSCPDSERSAIEEMRVEGRNLALAYRMHIARWNADNLMTDWSGYRQSTLMLIGQLRRHFEKIRQLIHPLFQRWLRTQSPQSVDSFARSAARSAVESGR